MQSGLNDFDVPDFDKATARAKVSFTSEFLRTDT